ncbi:MAG: helix-turn-helix domain-containing protein [Chloroflexota bacterium]
MTTIATLDTLAQLRREMAAQQRKAEEEALGEALACLAKTLNKAEDGVYTTGEAADRLGVSIPTVKRWIARGVLKGVAVGTRWLVGKEGVERIVRVRKTLAEMDEEEGNPTPEEFIGLRRRGRRADEGRVA